MPDDAETIAYCHACGKPMDVSSLAPFSNVECPSCGKHTRVKREFGPYTLMRRHAIGGMSVVFIAQDNTLGREVALKILNESYSADERRISAFEEEARITASFSHPHVVRVFTTGHAFGRFYIAMELVAGGHFEHQIREKGTITERELLPLAIQVAEGLKAAHAAGLIHRDIKPGNILLDAEGNAKIVDFGLALVTKGGSAQAQEIWATPYYVPPETIEGHAEDFRSDLYAFGATLYHALAGKPSCAEESMATHVLREAKQKVVPLQMVAPWLSLETCAVVERAMAYDPSARFGSYEEMISLLKVALQRAQSAPVVAAGVAGAGAVAGRPGGQVAGGRRRRKAGMGERLAMAGAGMWVVGALVGAGWWVMQDAPEVDDLPIGGGDVVEVPAADPGAVPQDAEAASRIAGRYREARAAVDGGEYEKAREAFAALREDGAVQEPTRSWAAVEAVAAGLLDGRSDAARKEAVETREHLRGAKLANPRIRTLLLPVISEMSEMGVLRVDGGGAGKGGAAEVMSLMLAGLKNWEQGAMAEAVPMFEAVRGVKLPQQDSWAAVYQKLAGDYVADHEALSAPVFGAFPEDVAGCDAAVEELNGVLEKLRTKGRARFNVRAWQLDLTKHARRLKTKPAVDPTKEPAVPEVVAGDAMAKLRAYADECRFSDAAVWLKSLVKDPEGASRDSLLALAESATIFLADMESDLKAGGATLTLERKDGGKLTRAEASEKPGHFRGINAAAEAEDVPWGALTADSIIELHRVLVRNQTGELEKLNRYECAIAFDWLAGDRQRASTAAERLGQQNPRFKRRWDGLVAGLPK